MVCRDHSANILFVWTKIADVYDPLIASLAVCKAKELRFNFILFEGDSLKVIQAIQGDPLALVWSIDFLVKDISNLLSHFTFPFRVSLMSLENLMLLPMGLLDGLCFVIALELFLSLIFPLMSWKIRVKRVLNFCNVAVMQ